MSADRREVVLNPDGQQHNHNNLPLPADMPDVYYDISNLEIIIDGLGVVNYYDVEIASASSFITVISTQVNGSYDTIDVSSLPQGEYVITIESPLGNTYEGFFDTY
ncbi:MAG: hypothetical protein IJK93_00515 [Muribaculaceae bacterium]|nr:hypothetical protein [Muribaculaceae bacterium]